MTEKPRCLECGSGQVYYRRLLKDFVCRRCGNTWKKKPKRKVTKKVAKGGTKS